MDEIFNEIQSQMVINEMSEELFPLIDGAFVSLSNHFGIEHKKLIQAFYTWSSNYKGPRIDSFELIELLKRKEEGNG